MKMGDKIRFGDFDWRLLEVRDGRALVITEYIIEQHPYHDAYEDITWADCALRAYLNGEFYNRFNEAEKSRIHSAVNANHDNQWYGTMGGADTEDCVFLLSMEEAVCNYFGDSSEKLYNPAKNQRYWFERKDTNNFRRIACLEDNREQVWWWWTRTPGRTSVKAVYIHGDGNIGIQGNNVLKGNIADGRCTGGVRPALWLKIK